MKYEDEFPRAEPPKHPVDWESHQNKQLDKALGEDLHEAISKVAEKRKKENRA